MDFRSRQVEPTDRAAQGPASTPSQEMQEAASSSRDLLLAKPLPFDLNPFVLQREPTAEELQAAADFETDNRQARAIAQVPEEGDHSKQIGEIFRAAHDFLRKVGVDQFLDYHHRYGSVKAAVQEESTDPNGDCPVAWNQMRRDLAEHGFQLECEDGSFWLYWSRDEYDDRLGRDMD